MSNLSNQYLGIDIGSLAMSAVILDETKQILYSSYHFHNGQTIEGLNKILSEIDLPKI